MIKLFILAVVSRTSSKVLVKLSLRGKWAKPGLPAPGSEPIEHCGGPHQVLCMEYAMGSFCCKQRTLDLLLWALPVAFPDSEI